MNPKSSSKRPTVGVLAGWPVFTGTPDPFLAHVIQGIQAAAQDLDCNLLLACGIDSGKPAWPLVSPHVDFIPVGPQNTDGLVIVSPFASSAGERYAHNLVESGFPVVYAGDRETGPAVVADNAGGIRQAVGHLVEHGHRRIAFVAGRLHAEHGDSGIRLQAFQREMAARGLLYDPALVAFGLHTYEGGRQAIQKLLSAGHPFTAVIASNDGSAMGVLAGLHQAGLVVPQDIALIGFDDRLEARAQVPPLTTVHYPMYSLGYQSVALLLRAIHGEPVADELVRIPTSLVVRETCGCGPGSQLNHQGGVWAQEASGAMTREASLSTLNREITTAVVRESLWMSEGEIAYLGTRLVEAFIRSLEGGDSQVFLQVIKQILERVSARGDDLFIWQAAITILRQKLPTIEDVFSPQMTLQQQEDLLHQGRAAISEVALGQFTRALLRQTHEADRVGLMTSKFFAAHEEGEIYAQLAMDLPAIGIQHAMVGYYQPESEDPVAWSLLQTRPTLQGEHPALSVGTRFLSLQFPPEGLYPPEVPYQLALLPLKIEDSLMGFVAFEAGNLNPCAEIVRHLGAALRSVRLYREAVDARKQAEEGERLAEEANRLKSRFLSMVSHELRTPLNLITGLSNILLEEYRHAGSIRPGDPNHSFEEDLNRIYISAQHLDGLIRDVLDLASSHVGQLKLVCEPLDMTEVLSAVSVIGRQLAHDKGLAWQVEIQGNLPRVWGDRTRLRQVALNLVNNAVKFTSQGGISLTALAEDSRVVVQVQDTGLGIPLHEQEVIFDEFRRSERATSRGYGGLGLGLAICRKLVEMHGGEIGVSSSGDEGQGSMFSFSLPVYEHQVDLTDKGVPVFEGHRVSLLVDDQGGSQGLLEKLIEQGYQAEASLIREESDWLADLLLASPDIVLLDLGLTSSRGWEILKVLKENPATQDIPVMFYRVEQDTQVASLLDLDYLTKPVASHALGELLASKGFLTPDRVRDDSRPILVVDDDPGMLEMHARIVSDQLPDHRVLLARDGYQALRLIYQERPALVLLDLRMPEMDGFEVLEEMRGTELSRTIPVVVITGQVLDQEDMDRLNTGVASVLKKGMFRVEEILEHLENALANRRTPGSEAQRMVLKAMAFIHTHYTEPVSRRDISDFVGMSERHLTRCFHQEVGITPITYLNRYRVKQSKALLDAGDMGITEIALEVGFSSHSYFSRVFREQVGVSPRAYVGSGGSEGE